MTEVRSQPCSACPYRLDVPSGVWDASEYDKLRGYDRPTGEQPWQTFACHATPDHYCAGWAIVHTKRGNPFDLLALRLFGYPTIPTTKIPLFASGNDAADWGQRDITTPSEEAVDTMVRLTRKYPRLREAAEAKEATDGE